MTQGPIRDTQRPGAATGEVITGAEEEEEERAVALVPIRPAAHVQSGLGAVAALSDAEFEANIAMLRRAVTRARQMQAALLEEGTDYGTVKGVKRPFLHKPGAEKFEKAYGLATSYTVERHVGDGEGEPDLEFIVHARVHLGSTDGPVVGEGLGAANSWETKYRYRQGAARLCPECGKQNVIKLPPRRDRPETFWCGTRDGGCGRAFALDDPRLHAEAEKVENTDPWDLANTLLKMARKRAHVDGILTATGTSGLFTQDEDAPVVPPSEAEAPRATGPAERPPARDPDAPGRWVGAVTKIDPPTRFRQAKITWLDGDKAVHEKVEIKLSLSPGGTLTVVLVDALAIAAAAAGIASGEMLCVDGEPFERIWMEGKPPIREIRNPPALWRYRAGAWQPIAPAAGRPPEPDLDPVAAEEAILDQLDLPVEKSWREVVAGLPPMLVRHGESYTRTGYLTADLELGQKGDTLIVNGLLGVPDEGIFKFACGEPETNGLTERGAPRFVAGDRITIVGVGHITGKGTNMLIVHAAGV